MGTTEVVTSGMRIALILFPVLCALGVITFVAGFLLNKKLSDHAKALLTLALVLLIVASAAMGSYWNGGPELVAKGTRNLGLVNRLDGLHVYLDSETHVQAEDKFSICVFGDSTHFYKLEPRDRMLPQLQNEFPREYKNSVEWYGIHALGFDAYDFLFLLNWIVSEKPNLVVIPLNLRAFGYNWVHTPLVLLPELERYIQLAEIPTAMRLSNKTHELRWEHILLRKLDFAMFESQLGRFFRGVKLTYNETNKNIDKSIEERFATRAAPLPYDKVRPKVNFFEYFARRYQIDFSNGHSMLDAFEQLNRLAHENDVEVMYYTVQCEDEKVPQEEHFEYIHDRLANDPGVHFVDLLGLVKPEQFSLQEHLTKEGIEVVASHLSTAIAEIMRQRTGRS